MSVISTLPAWVIAAAICAFVGAIAGLIGGVLVKRGLAWGRFLPIVAIAAAVPVANGGLVDAIRGATLTEDTAAEMLVATSPGFYGMLQQDFPEDFQALTSEITESLRAGGTGAEVAGRSAAAVAQLRRKYAPMVARASDANHQAIMGSLIEFYTALNTQDPALCTSVAINGPMVLIGRPELQRFVSMMEPQAILAMEAAKNGLEQPVSRLEATGAAWGEVTDAMIARGATEAQLDAMATLDPASRDLCPALLILMQTLNAEETEAVKAVRAQYIADVASA